MSERLSDPSGAVARESRLDLTALLWRASPVLLIVGTWLVFHPYRGVVHDSRLYVVQAFHWLQPEIFGRDLFFAFGSQDSFTLFSPLFAFLIEQLGLAPATMLLVAAGHALWLSGAAALASRLLPERATLIAGLVLVASLSPYYAAWTTMSYGEGFVTPRPFAEALSLWAFYALSHRRLATAAILMIPAIALHPLIAVATLCSGFAYLAFRDLRWVWLGLLGCIAVIVLAVIGVAPFDRLTETMDAEWLDIIARRNVYLLPTLWTASEWARLVFATVTALCSASLLSGWRRTMMLAMVAAGLAGTLITFIGGDLLHNLLVLQVQLYRTLWLLYLFSNLGAGLVLVRLWREKEGPTLSILLVLSWTACVTVSPLFGAPIGLAVLGFAMARIHGRAAAFSERARLGVYILAGLLIGFFLAFRVAAVLHNLSYLPEERSFWIIFTEISRIDAAIAAALAAILWFHRPALVRSVLPAAAVILVVVGASLWDRRDPWTRIVMAPDLRTPFEAHLAPDALVFWEYDIRGAWLVLKRPAYISQSHGAGIVFTRETALTYRDRTRELEPLGYELVDTWGTIQPAPPELDRATLTTVCRNAPALDALILSRAVAGSIAATWNLPTPITDGWTTKETGKLTVIRQLHLYRCADLR